ncbi:hypothetical protein HIC20_01095 [Buchnera aphidicola (Hormaphis cornu)]|nr:hypothetical protein HIC20_01095 [Buchnera aphidicola (Hormaphis cornu)]
MLITSLHCTTKKTLFSKKQIICIQIQKKILLKRNQTLYKLSQISTQDIILIIYCDKNITIEQQKKHF